MCDRSYESPIKLQDKFCSALTRQDSISTLTFDDVPASASASASHQMGIVGGGTRPSPMDLNEVGHHQGLGHGNPSWDQGGAARAICNKQLKQFNQQMAEIAETTLEEFFVHTGFMNYEICEHDRVEYNNDNGVNQPLLQQLNQINPVTMDPMALTMSLQRPAAVDWVQQQMMAMSSKMELAECSGENRADSGFEVGFSESQLSSFRVPVAAGIFGGSPGDSGLVTDKKRRCTDEVFDKSVERRKKRMIKNRESAARSRARKQAYNNQLEAEVAHLRKGNNLLREQKERELRFKSESNPMPRYQLRRTSSAQF